MTRATKDELRALAARAEAAQGADRRLDGEVWCGKQGRPYVMWDGAGVVYRGVDGSIGHRAADRIPAYTASLDAALTLVPKGWRWIVDGDGNATCLPCGMRGNPVEHIYAATPALALTAAALRARAEELTDDR